MQEGPDCLLQKSYKAYWVGATHVLSYFPSKRSMPVPFTWRRHCCRLHPQSESFQRSSRVQVVAGRLSLKQRNKVQQDKEEHTNFCIINGWTILTRLRVDRRRRRIVSEKTNRTFRIRNMSQSIELESLTDIRSNRRRLELGLDRLCRHLGSDLRRVCRHLSRDLNRWGGHLGSNLDRPRRHLDGDQRCWPIRLHRFFEHRHGRGSKLMWIFVLRYRYVGYRHGRDSDCGWPNIRNLVAGMREDTRKTLSRPIHAATRPIHAATRWKRLKSSGPSAVTATQWFSTAFRIANIGAVNEIHTSTHAFVHMTRSNVESAIGHVELVAVDAGKISDTSNPKTLTHSVDVQTPITPKRIEVVDATNLLESIDKISLSDAIRSIQKHARSNLWTQGRHECFAFSFLESRHEETSMKKQKSGSRTKFWKKWRA